MTELADKIEAASGPSRELDAEIAVQARGFLTRPNRAWPDKTDYGYVNADGAETWPGQGFDQLVPRYTASLDAALSLAPEGWKLRQMNFSAPCADDRKWHLNLHGGREGEDRFVGRGATPALALVSAALRAGDTDAG